MVRQGIFGICCFLLLGWCGCSRNQWEICFLNGKWKAWGRKRVSFGKWRLFVCFSVFGESEIEESSKRKRCQIRAWGNSFFGPCLSGLNNFWTWTWTISLFGICWVIGLLFNYSFLGFIFLLLPWFGPSLYTAYVHRERPLFLACFNLMFLFVYKKKIIISLASDHRERIKEYFNLWIDSSLSLKVNLFLAFQTVQKIWRWAALPTLFAHKRTDLKIGWVVNEAKVLIFVYPSLFSPCILWGLLRNLNTIAVKFRKNFFFAKKNSNWIGLDSSRKVFFFFW